MSVTFDNPLSSFRFLRIEDSQGSITREQMDEFVRSGNIKEIKASLSQCNVFERMLSEHFFEPKVLNQLLISAVKDNHEQIAEAMSEDLGGICPEEFEDLELAKLVGLLVTHQLFDPGTIHLALKKASKYGRFELISQILLKVDISEEIMQSALLQAVRKGWLEVVDLLLEQSVSKRLHGKVWRKALDLSCLFGFRGIARSLIKAMGSVELDEIKKIFSEHSPDLDSDTTSVLALIDECLDDIEYLRTFCIQKPMVKRKRLDLHFLQ